MSSVEGFPPDATSNFGHTKKINSSRSTKHETGLPSAIATIRQKGLQCIMLEPKTGFEGRVLIRVGPEDFE